MFPHSCGVRWVCTPVVVLWSSGGVQAETGQMNWFSTDTPIYAYDERMALQRLRLYCVTTLRPAFTTSECGMLKITCDGFGLWSLGGILRAP